MIEEYLKDLQEAKRPVLLVGGGGTAMSRALGERLKIPCIPTWNAVDIITNDFPYYRGRIGTYGIRYGNFTIQNSDLVLAIGCRFSGRITGGMVESFARNAKIYAVDIDQSQLDNSTVKLTGAECIDSRSFISALLSYVDKIPDFTDWLNKTKEWMVKYPVVLPEYYDEKRFVHPYVFIKTLSDLLNNDDIIVADCGGNVVVTYQAFETKWGQRLISSHGNSPMGFSFAGALGACLAHPEKRVICLIGDGGFNMNIQELQTIKNYDIKNLKCFIMNNHIYGMSKQFQEANFNSRYIAVGGGNGGYNPPNFRPIVLSYGIDAGRIKQPDDLCRALQKYLSHSTTIIVDVDMGDYCKYEPRIAGWTPIEDMSPLLPYNEFVSNMIISQISREKVPGEGYERAAWHISSNLP
jgi:acetolactate synthase-1/2/3 large subunit